MNSAWKSTSHLLITAILALAISALILGCEGKSDGDDDDSTEAAAFVPTEMISFEALFSGGPNVQVTAENVTLLMRELHHPDGQPNTIAIDCFHWRLVLGMTCMGAGTAQLQYCTDVPLGFDVVFDGCMADEDNGIKSGTIKIKTDPISTNLLNVEYIDFSAIQDGTPFPTFTMALDLFVTRTGDLLGYLFVKKPLYLVVVGVDEKGDLCFANVGIDPTNRFWRSDEACGLPAGPVYY